MTRHRIIWILLVIVIFIFMLLCYIMAGRFISFLNSLTSDKQLMEDIYTEWFQIPSNGEGELHFTLRLSNTQKFKNENEFWFGNMSDSCTRREDVYDVYDYHPNDSMFILKLINTLDIDTTLQMHELKFYLYSPNPTVYSQHCNWEVKYHKLQFDTLFSAETKEIIPHIVNINKQLFFVRFPEFSNDYRHNRSEFYEFVYDEQRKQFQPVKDHKSFYYRQRKDGKISSHTVTFFY